MKKKGKVLLINPPVRTIDVARNIPHGIAIMGSIIRNDNWEVKIVDMNANRNLYEKKEQELKNLIINENFKIIGIGGIVTIYKPLKELSLLIKSIKNDVTIIAGGTGAYVLPEFVLNNTMVDIICIGESEITILELLNAINEKSGFEDVKGICFKNNGEIIKTENRELIKNIDNFVPFPAWDLLPMETYLKNPVVGIGKDIDFISSRGCPYNCTFCYPSLGRKVRLHSEEYILSAMKYLKNKYNIDFISFQDDEFMVSKDRILKLCEGILKCGLDIKWSVTGRVNLVNEDTLEAMKTAGCTSVSYGIESGSQKMLDIMNKNVTVQVAKEGILLTRKVGLRNPTSYIIGMPGETKETIEETINFCIELNIPLQVVMFATPYPGSKIFNDCLTNGKIKKDKLEEFIINLGDAVDFRINLTDDFTDEELIKMRNYMIEKVLKNVRKPPVNKLRKFYRELYGKRLFSLATEQLKNDEKFRLHRKLRGFNEWTEI